MNPPPKPLPGLILLSYLVQRRKTEIASSFLAGQILFHLYRPNISFLVFSGGELKNVFTSVRSPFSGHYSVNGITV